MGSRVSIPSGRRQHLDEAGRLADVDRFDVVSVGSGCWVGEGSILLASIGDRCIVSAGAMTTCALVPPKPKEFTPAHLRVSSPKARGVVQTLRFNWSNGIAGLRLAACKERGNSPCFSDKSAFKRPARPDAASV